MIIEASKEAQEAIQSAGYYDAYYKRAQQLRTVVQKSFKAALDSHDILISPAAPSATYKFGEKKNDPLAMYAGDIMTVNVNLAGLPALVLPCGFVKDGTASLPIGFQMIGAAFDEVGLFS
ncbi:putative glutaminyl-tRNA synthase (glutamine-hydrolyzing) [Helianthus annuus]|nr:putative glutaminyl-tRNA synthase (glutamine-hydrolyzing) [Helianthus annuus]KAJ0667794.1 putative glutaminyl-tRNA synthase (glutamine-hydrolyzing) [Helianthus annuus]